VLFAIVGYGALHYAPLPAPPGPARLPESLKIVDRQGRLLYDSAGAGDARYTHVALADLPPYVAQAVIATEDASFYDNPGIDLKGVARAALTDVRHGDTRAGGSTITQQLARNLYYDAEERAEPSIARKVGEAFMALRIDRAYSKDEILEQYLNRAYFGNLAFGLEAASWTYFDKPARDLDLAEAALLAGLLQAPADYDPLTKLDAARARQATVLDRMVDEDYITREQAEAAARESIAINETPFPIEAPHFTAWVRDELLQIVGQERLSRGDLRVVTTLDLDLQRQAQASVAWHVSELSDKNVTTGAVVVIDPRSGHVLAMVGSANYFEESIDGAYNAALAERQPGSSIKPIIYAAALETGYSPATALFDIPTTLRTRTGQPYAPNNYDLKFHGIVPLREALASSYNVPAVRVLASIGIERAVETGRRFGLTTFRDPSRYDLSLALGGGEVRLLDMTTAYAGLAAGGVRVEPIAVLRIEDAGGDVIWEAPERTRERVVSEQTAYLLSDILSDNDARAPGFGSNSPLSLPWPAAAKTGTTTDFRDNWTVGYTPELAVGVWVGNADNSPMIGVTGVDGAAPVWREVMLAAVPGETASGFVRPAGIESAAVCLPSGMRPTDSCQRRRMELFASGTAPANDDEYYRALLICEPAGVAVVDAMACAGEVRERVFSFVPVEAIPWARAAGIALPPVAPYASALPVFEVARPISAEVRLVSPVDGTSFRMSRELRAEDQALRIEAQPSTNVAFVELFVDGSPVAHLDDAPYRSAWLITIGEHTVRARAVGRDGAEHWSVEARITVLAP
jgi:1A family penicillin-binding protein